MSIHSSTLPEGYPLYVKGDVKLVKQLKLAFSANLSFPKPIPIMIPFIPNSKENISKIPLLQPIIYLEIIDDIIRDQVIKGKYQLKLDTFYIYFPTQFRVDEKIYKGLVKNFQALLDQVPRNIKPYLHKLILWEEGKGENSIEMQKHKISQSLSEISKQLIQKKLASFASDIKQYQSQPSTAKSLLHIFLLKNKLACLYSHLNLRQFAHDLLSDVWNQMMINFRCLMKLSPSNKFGSIQKLQFPEDIPKLPYNFANTNDILGYFQSNHSTAYLRIVTHSFIKYFDYCLALGMEVEALTKLKYFMDFVLNNVLVLARRNQWNKKQMGLFDLARNLWAVEVITKCMKDFKQSWDGQDKKKEKQKLSKLGQNHEQIGKYKVSIMSMLRNSTQRIGLILYSFDNYSIFPTTIPLELSFIYDRIKKLKQPWRQTKKSVDSIKQQQKEEIVEKTSSMLKREMFALEIPEIGPNQLRIRQLIGEKMVPSMEITKILVSFQAYSQVYLQVLQQMFEVLKESPYKNVAKSLKLTLERATIMLGDWQDYQKVHDEPYQFEKQWPQLHAIQQLYRLFFLLVKFLSSQLQDSQMIAEQVVRVLTKTELNQFHKEQIKEGNKQNDRLVSVFQIAQTVSQVLETYGVKLKVGCAKKIILKSSDNEKERDEKGEIDIQIVIDSSNIEHLLSKSDDWKIMTTQVMLAEGEKVFNLKQIKCREYKRCQNCEQCSTHCSNKGEHLTIVTGKLEFEQNQQYLFHIKNLVLALPVSESQIKLQLQVSRQIEQALYKINSPTLSLITEYNPIVYAETWAPLGIRIQNVRQGVQIVQINVEVRNFVHGIKQAQSNVQFKIQEDQSQNKFDGGISISKLVHFESQHSPQQHQYLEISSILNKHLKSPHIVSIFALSPKPDKIQRRSKRRNEHHETNNYVFVEVTFKSLSNDRPFTLSLSTGHLTIKPLLELNYMMVQTCQQFSVTNLRNMRLLVWERGKEVEDKDECFVCELDQGEVFCVESRFLEISYAEYPKMKAYINLNEWFDQQHLLTKKNNTFSISYRPHHSYQVFKPIQIESQIIGSIQIPYLETVAEQGLELAGKIKGKISYRKYIQNEKQREDKSINLWIIPIKTGNIVLPELWIDGKRGIWVNSLVTNVQPAD